LRLSVLRPERLRCLPGVALALVLGELFGHQETLADTRRAARFNSGPIGKALFQRRADVLRKASPPSGGVDSSGRISGPKSFRSRGKRLWKVWRGGTRPRPEPTESSAKLLSFHSRSR